MRALFAGLVLIAVPYGCSKKSDPPTASGSGTAAAPAPTPPGAAPPPSSGSAAAAKPAPTITPALFVAEPTKFTIEALERGLWISDNGGAFRHACRVELGTAMGRAGKLRGVAMKTPDAVTCEPKGSYTVCSFAMPAADQSSPDRNASWVFATDDDSDETVLIAVLYGPYDWAAIEPKLPPKQACPRPSADR